MDKNANASIKRYSIATVLLFIGLGLVFYATAYGIGNFLHPEAQDITWMFVLGMAFIYVPPLLLRLWALWGGLALVGMVIWLWLTQLMK